MISHNYSIIFIHTFEIHREIKIIITGKELVILSRIELI